MFWNVHIFGGGQTPGFGSPEIELIWRWKWKDCTFHWCQGLHPSTENKSGRHSFSTFCHRSSSSTSWPKHKTAPSTAVFKPLEAKNGDLVVEEFPITFEGYTYKYGRIAYVKGRDPRPVILVHHNYCGLKQFDVDQACFMARCGQKKGRGWQIQNLCTFFCAKCLWLNRKCAFFSLGACLLESCAVMCGLIIISQKLRKKEVPGSFKSLAVNASMQLTLRLGYVGLAVDLYQETPSFTCYDRARVSGRPVDRDAFHACAKEENLLQRAPAEYSAPLGLWDLTGFWWIWNGTNDMICIDMLYRTNSFNIIQHQHHGGLSIIPTIDSPFAV